MPHVLPCGVRATTRERGVIRRLHAFLISAALVAVVAAVQASPVAGGRRASAWSDRASGIATARGHTTFAGAAAAQPRLGHTRPRATARMHDSKPVAISGPRRASMRPASPSLVGTPAQALTTFDGIAQAEAGGFEPPDSWTAANASYVLHSVNSLVRVYSRTGQVVQSAPIDALFALPAAQTATDPRFIWDATHSRWVGVIASYNFNDTDDFLNLAVSESADPLGGWNVYAFPFGDVFPDYPGIASSTASVVLTDTDFGSGLTTLDGSTLTIVDWSALLAPSVIPYYQLSAANSVNPRPAQVLSPSPYVHLIWEDIDTRNILYGQVQGHSVPGATVADITSDTTWGPFIDPVSPRQPGGTIADGAIDGRATDAVWRNGHLWFVSTLKWLNAPSQPFDGVRVTELLTTATTPTVNVDILLNENGADDFMGGIGLSGNGTLFVVYSRSSSSDFVSTQVRTSADSFTAEVELGQSNVAYTGPFGRWGDYVGVAADPVGGGSVWLAHELVADSGTWETDVARVVIDTDNPSQPGPVSQALVVPATVTASIPTRVAWGASTDSATNVDHYNVLMNVDGAGFSSIASSSTGTSLVRPLLFGHRYQFRVSAVDAAGHTGTPRDGPSFVPVLYQQTSTLSSAKVTYTGTWTTSSTSSFSGGTARYATAAGASATFTATLVRGIGFVTTRASTRGSFKVYVDGVFKATVSASSSTTRYRQDVYQFSWATAGTHKIKIVVSGTSGHPRVDVDAFIALK
jgi:hypothetical protein